MYLMQMCSITPQPKAELKTMMGIKLLADKVEVMTEFLRESKVDEESFYAVIWNSLFI